MSKPSTSPPSAAEFGLLRARLATAGATPAQINAAVGAVPGGRSRRQIADSLKAWLKTLPRA